MPTGDIRGVMQGARVIPTHSVSSMLMGDGLLGRGLDGAGRPLAGFGDLKCTEGASLTGEPLNPLIRRAIPAPPAVGGGSINAPFPVAAGHGPALLASAAL